MWLSQPTNDVEIFPRHHLVLNTKLILRIINQGSMMIFTLIYIDSYQGKII